MSASFVPGQSHEKDEALFQSTIAILLTPWEYATLHPLELIAEVDTLKQCFILSKKTVAQTL
jgi:hypothetical protein